MVHRGRRCLHLGVFTNVSTTQVKIVTQTEQSVRARHYLTVPLNSISSTSTLANVPHVTVIRPIEGLDANLYDCLAATFHQDYPASKLTVHLCISSRSAPAYAVLEQLLCDFPTKDAHLFVEDEDPIIHGNATQEFHLGPNPKIRNMSRAYREAKGDIVWIIDCNVWVGHGVCGRMVDKLCGYTPTGLGQPYKFVHLLPLVIDVGGSRASVKDAGLLDGEIDITTGTGAGTKNFGTRLEESFLSSSHAKFYTAINTVAIAPCIVGKSNMFRRSHLNHLTASETSDPSVFATTTASDTPPTPPGSGIDYFSHNICEDHLIGDILWRSNIPPSLLTQPPTSISVRPKIRNHGLVYGDFAIQPLSSMSVSSYIARRVRWLRVRKWTVILATWVEPGTESFLCSLYGAFAISTLPVFHKSLGLPPTWTTFILFWLINVSIWCSVDWTLYNLLHSGRSIELDVNTPRFVEGSRDSDKRGRRKKTFPRWLIAWLGREALALPIWTWAFWGGTTVKWRDKSYQVGMDMKVHRIPDKSRGHEEMNGSIKSRQD